MFNVVVNEILRNAKRWSHKREFNDYVGDLNAYFRGYRLNVLQSKNVTLEDLMILEVQYKLAYDVLVDNISYNHIGGRQV